MFLCLVFGVLVFWCFVSVVCRVLCHVCLCAMLVVLLWVVVVVFVCVVVVVVIVVIVVARCGR